MENNWFEEQMKSDEYKQWVEDAQRWLQCNAPDFVNDYVASFEMAYPIASDFLKREINKNKKIKAMLIKITKCHDLESAVTIAYDALKGD